MKFLVAAFALLAAFACASAAVLPSAFEALYGKRLVRLEDVDSDGGLDAIFSQRPSPNYFRQTRDLTCDFFSFESQVVTPNHAACALKCVGKGRGGGHCEGTTCVCRNDKWVPW